MSWMNGFPGGGGAPSWDKNVSRLVVESNGTDAIVRWSDPIDTNWKDTFVVRKVGGAPENDKDGIQIVDSLIRDQYKAAGYTDVAVPSVGEVWYKLFPRNSKNALTNNVVNVALLPRYSPVFSDNSWPMIALACNRGEVPSTWAIGDLKPVVMNGGAYNFRIAGKNHYDLDSSDPQYGTSYNGGANKAALVLDMKETYSQQYAMNSTDTNTTSWNDTLMRLSTMPLLESYMPSELRTELRTVKILTAQSGTDSTIITTADKLFLPSRMEVFGDSSGSHSGEGVQLAYYAAGNSKIKTTGNPIYYWSLRSPVAGERMEFIMISPDGRTYMGRAASRYGVSVCFCM